MKKRPMVLPGEILQKEFLDGCHITAYRLARETGIVQTGISEIIRGTRRITPETALCFARYFGTSPEFRLNLQGSYDLQMAETEPLRERMARIMPIGSSVPVGKRTGGKTLRTV